MWCLLAWVVVTYILYFRFQHTPPFRPDLAPFFSNGFLRPPFPGFHAPLPAAAAIQASQVASQLALQQTPGEHKFQEFVPHKPSFYFWFRKRNNNGKTTSKPLTQIYSDTTMITPRSFHSISSMFPSTQVVIWVQLWRSRPPLPPHQRQLNLQPCHLMRYLL